MLSHVRVVHSAAAGSLAADILTRCTTACVCIGFVCRGLRKWLWAVLLLMAVMA